MPLGIEHLLRGRVPRKARDALYAGKQIMTGNQISKDYGKKCVSWCLSLRARTVRRRRWRRRRARGAHY